MEVREKTVRCEDGHSFDVARQGYVNFLTNHTFVRNADSAAMVAARQKMHARPFFQDLAHQISDICEDVITDTSSLTVVEPGGGTGFYANVITERSDNAQALSFDISTHAAKACARQSGRVASVVADVWQKWPIESNSVDVVLSVFSPRNLLETERVLREKGTLIIVTPEEDHLAELRNQFNALGIQRNKAEALAASLGNFTKIQYIPHESTELLDGFAMYDSLLSGPNGHHISEEDFQLISQAEPINVTHCVNISVWKLC